MTTIDAVSILASRNNADPDKSRVLHTVKARYPLWIHQEFLTHRVFSKNTASSRAIPIEKMIWEAEEDPAMPVYWTRNQPGMQGYEFLNSIEEQDAIDAWRRSRDSAVSYCRKLAGIGLHKQVANRLLQPYIHVSTVVSATEWSNFFAVRLHHSVEPHMKDLATVFAEATKGATVQTLNVAEWHIPFIEEADVIDAKALFDNPEFGGGYPDILIPRSVARCASISFKTVQNLDMTPAKAVALYDKLIHSEPLHASPAEHQAQADYGQYFPDRWRTTENEFVWRHAKDHRNFVGFRQWRSQLPRDTL